MKLSKLIKSGKTRNPRLWVRLLVLKNPSGTVSQLVDSDLLVSMQGYNPYYIRTVRGDNKDPITKVMKAQGFPSEPDVTKPNHTTVFSFPMASPENAVCRTDMTALEQLELWKVYAQNWCEHKPSVTISVKEDEWVDTAAWVYENLDEISGISFLPFSDHTTKHAHTKIVPKKSTKKW